MKKSKEHIKRFLSTVQPAEEKDEHLIRLFLNKRKIKVAVSAITYTHPFRDELDIITYEQLEAWYYSDMPTVGDVLKCGENGFIGLVTQEKWDSIIVGVILRPDKTLSYTDHRFSSGDWEKPSQDEIKALQKALSVDGKDWNPVSLDLVKREIPQSPKYVRLMEVGKEVGIGIFKEILPDNTLEMYCVKIGKEPIRYSGNLNLGDADYFSFFDTYDEHRALIQEELGEDGLIWNIKCRRIQKNSARAKPGKNYFWVTSYLEIKQATESDSASDKKRFNRGNYFLKRDVALRARNKIINVCKEEMMSEDNV